jgi:hypothetical protein
LEKLTLYTRCNHNVIESGGTNAEKPIKIGRTVGGGSTFGAQAGQ